MYRDISNDLHSGSFSSTVVAQEAGDLALQELGLEAIHGQAISPLVDLGQALHGDAYWQVRYSLIHIF